MNEYSESARHGGTEGSRIRPSSTTELCSRVRISKRRPTSETIVHRLRRLLQQARARNRWDSRRSEARIDSESICCSDLDRTSYYICRVKTALDWTLTLMSDNKNDQIDINMMLKRYSLDAICGKLNPNITFQKQSVQNRRSVSRSTCSAIRSIRTFCPWTSSRIICRDGRMSPRCGLLGSGRSFNLWISLAKWQFISCSPPLASNGGKANKHTFLNKNW